MQVIFGKYGGLYMALSYNKMRRLLVEKNMSMAELRKAANIAPNTMTKLRRDETVSIEILERICQILECDFGDIIEYVGEPDDIVIGLEKHR